MHYWAFISWMQVICCIEKWLVHRNHKLHSLPRMCTVRERLQKSYCPRLTFFLQHHYGERGKWIFKSLGNHSGINVKSSIIDYLFSLNSEQDFECTTCVFAFLIQLSGLHELFIIVDMINLFDICKLRADIYHTTPQYCFGQQSM